MALRVFIAWGGAKGQVLGGAIRTFLHALDPGIEVFLSSTKIESGQDWRNKIFKNVLQANVGVCAITPEFIQRPWPIWESGGLFFLREHRLKSKDSRLLPILWGVAAEELRGTPYEAFQCRASSSEEEMNTFAFDVCRLLDQQPTEADLAERAKSAWQEFDTTLRNARVPAPSHKSPLYLTELVEDIWMNQHADLLRQKVRPVLDKAQVDLERLAKSLDEPRKTDLPDVRETATGDAENVVVQRAKDKAAMQQTINDMTKIIGTLESVTKAASAFSKRTTEMKSRRAARSAADPTAGAST